MGSIMLLWKTLIVLSVAVATSKVVYCRAIDDVDNSVQPERETYFDKRDWVLIPQPPPAKVTQSFGESIELVCEVMGSPVPTVQWIQGDMPLDEVESMENTISESSPNAIVRIRSVLIIDHNLSSDKTYTCVGRNGPNYLYASTIVHPEHETNALSELLIHKPHGLSTSNGPQKPKIIHSYTQYMDIIGSSVVLPCKAKGHPHPEIYWLDNKRDRITDRKRYKVLPNGDLLISDLKWDDMGLFTCIARNSIGKDTAETFIYAAAKE